MFGESTISQDEIVTNEDIIELIHANNQIKLRSLVHTRGPLLNLNFLESCYRQDLDEQITPLTLAAYLGRTKIIEILLENPSLEIDMPTQVNEYSALCAASMEAHLETVHLLAENGADINYNNSMG